jgi:hypothetical protein
MAVPPPRPTPAGRFGGVTVLARQTWSIPSNTVQLPFDAAPPVHLHAAAGLSNFQVPHVPAPSPRLIADSPLRLVTATAAQELHLELHADHRQWCVKATDSIGRPLWAR